MCTYIYIFFRYIRKSELCCAGLLVHTNTHTHTHTHTHTETGEQANDAMPHAIKNLVFVKVNHMYVCIYE
jgi:hypothetical protein